MIQQSASKTVASWDAWSGMRPGVYDKAVYSSPLLRPLYDEELRIVRSREWSDFCLIEVGSGPGEFLLAFPGLFRATVGVERSGSLIAQARTASANDTSIYHVNGDAIHLNRLLQQGKLPDLNQMPKLVCCVMNTLGILEPKTRALVLREMADLIAPSDSFMITVFNRAYFRTGINSFYSLNPELCGTVEPRHYNAQAGDLRVDSTGYYSHWFTEDELKAGLLEAGFEDFDLQVNGVGLLAIGGRLQDKELEWDNKSAEAGIIAGRQI